MRLLGELGQLGGSRGSRSRKCVQPQPGGGAQFPYSRRLVGSELRNRQETPPTADICAPAPPLLMPTHLTIRVAPQCSVSPGVGRIPARSHNQRKGCGPPSSRKRGGMPPPLPNRQLTGVSPVLCDSIRSLPFSSRCHPGAFISCHGDDERVRLLRPQAIVVEAILEPCALPRAPLACQQLPAFAPRCTSGQSALRIIADCEVSPSVPSSAEGALAHCQWAWARRFPS